MFSSKNEQGTGGHVMARASTAISRKFSTCDNERWRETVKDKKERRTATALRTNLVGSRERKGEGGSHVSRHDSRTGHRQHRYDAFSSRVIAVLRAARHSASRPCAAQLLIYYPSFLLADAFAPYSLIGLFKATHAPWSQLKLNTTKSMQINNILLFLFLIKSTMAALTIYIVA